MSKKKEKTKNKKRKPFYKRLWFWIIVIILVAAAASGGSKDADNPSEDNSSTVSSEPSVAPADEPESVSESSAAPADESESVPETSAAPADESEPVPETSAAPADESESASEESPASDSALADLDITFYDEFRNDTTGRWRKALVATSTPIQDFAVDYYNEYFQSDDEVHVIYNFSLNTVNCINVYGDELFITITDYVDGEEHDAQSACSGTFLGEYHVNINTGEITYNSFEE